MRFWICESITSKEWVKFNWLCSYSVVQGPWTFAWSEWLWKSGWYLGDRLHYGRINRWLAFISGGIRNWSAVRDSKNIGSVNIWIARGLFKKSKISGHEIPRNSEARNFRKKIFGEINKKSPFFLKSKLTNV